MYFQVERVLCTACMQVLTVELFWMVNYNNENTYFWLLINKNETTKNATPTITYEPQETSIVQLRTVGSSRCRR